MAEVKELFDALANSSELLKLKLDENIELQRRVKELEEALKHAKMTFFYIRNLSHQAWRDKPNLEAVCTRIENYAQTDYELLESLLSNSGAPNKESK